MTGPGPGQIRRAVPTDADLLTGLTLRSKAHWGYDAQFMAAIRDDLTVTPAALAAGISGVSEIGGRIAGYYLLASEPNADLSLLFVDPDYIGNGVGAALWAHMLTAARTQDIASIRIEADPNAEGFYRRMGAVTIGDAPSGSIPGRRLPLMNYDLS